jgi:transcriptional regulator with XRE-family HTH domain
MLASSLSLESGNRLRAAREYLRLSLRDVQRMSRDIAERKRNPEYYIAHASLADIEKGRLIPTIYKLYSLSVIYGIDYEKLAAYFNVPIAHARQDHDALIFPRTYLVGPASELGAYDLSLGERLRSERTNLVPKILEKWKEVAPALLQQMDGRDSLYGYIGMQDRTLDPIVRPGSFVQIDSRQRTISTANWHDDHDRPIFFFELRDRYVCCWCELHGSQLILVPTPHSRGQTRHIRYPGDATIVGRVTAIAMRIAEARESPGKGVSLT